jgi:hypothetical protein
MTLTHDRRAGEQTSGEEACLLTAGAKVVERVEAPIVGDESLCS